MPPLERRPLVQVGPAIWVAIADVQAIYWDSDERCPLIVLTSGKSFPATYFTSSGVGDTPVLRTEALIRLLRKARKRSADILAAKDLLTPRETEVLALLAQSESTTSTAKLLFMSESTVKEHVGNIYKKLGVHNRAGAMMAAIHIGILDPDPTREIDSQK